MPSLLKPFRAASQGLLKAADSLVPNPPSFGLLTPDQQAQARDQSRMALIGSLLQSSAPSLTPQSGLSTLGQALERSQGVANQAAQQALQGRFLEAQTRQAELAPLLKVAEFQADLEAARAAAATDAEKERIDNLFALGDDIVRESGEFISQRDSFGRIRASGQDPSAAGDLALIFNYMKLLDPNSVVRESEFANAQNTGSVPQRVWATYNRVLSGERLAPDQRQDFLDRAERLFTQASEDQKRRNSRFRSRAEDAGIKTGVENILIPIEPSEVAQSPNSAPLPPDAVDPVGEVAVAPLATDSLLGLPPISNIRRR